MKSLYNKLNIIATTCFVLGVVFSVSNLYNLTIDLEKASRKIDLTLIREVSPVLDQTYLIIGLTLFMGLACIIIGFYLRKSTNTTEQLAYTEKREASTEKQKETTDKKGTLAKEVKDIHAGIKDIKDQKEKYGKILSALCKKIEASQGIVYSVQREKEKRYIELFATYAYTLPDSEKVRYEFGEGLSGQVAKEGKKINIKDIPEGYITIVSGLGSSSPNHLGIFPIKKNGEVVYVVEIASFREISASDEALIAEALKVEEGTLPVQQEGMDKKVAKKVKVSD